MHTGHLCSRPLICRINAACAAKESPPPPPPSYSFAILLLLLDVVDGLHHHSIKFGPKSGIGQQLLAAQH